MTTFKHYRLRSKLAIMIAVILALTAGANGVLVYRLNSLNAEISVITSDRLPSAVAVGNIDSYASDLRIAQLQHAFSDDEAEKKRLQLLMVDLIEKIEKNQDVYEPLIDSKQEEVLYERFEDRWGEYLDLGYEFLELSLNNQHSQAIELLNGEAEEVFDNIGAILEDLVLVNKQASIDAASRAEDTYERAKRLSLMTLVFVILVAAAFATVLVRLITRPVKQLAAAAQRVADGDIGVELDVVANDEIGDLSRSFNAMTASLRDARDRIEAQQYSLEVTNRELESKNSDLEDALKQLRETQQQLVMREKMASLGNLVAGVAHEINNPVGAVKSAADTSARSIELVRRAIGESAGLDELKNNERFSTALEILKSNNDITVTASERIADIIRSLKNFARLDEAEFQQADIHEGLDSTLTLLHHELKNRINVEKHYGDLPRVQCYPNQLNQVFMNVLSNAEQAIEGEGTITITTEQRGENVVVKINDDGRGIRLDELERVFDPGFTTKGVGVGTGLGLSISYNIVEKHHGRIEAESAPGRGTTITITIPIAQRSP
jgi:signal transduction histidine kinase